MNVFQSSSLTPLCKHVFILEPQLSGSSSDVHSLVKLSNEFGKQNNCQDLKSVLLSLGYDHVEICGVSLDNYESVISSIHQKFLNNLSDVVFFNLCDGCETDGYPGIGLVKLMDKLQIPYTGSSPQFYDITTSKPRLKAELMKHNVPTSVYLEVTESTTEQDIETAFDSKYPLIVKPSVSYASLSITDHSVVHNARDALKQAQAVRKQCLTEDSLSDSGLVFIERFLDGKEYTSLIIGDNESGYKVFDVAERVFDPKLGRYQRILAFDRYWDGYDLEGNVPANPQSVYWYALAQSSVQQYLKQLTVDSYKALGGSGYARVDIRTSSLEADQDAYVLEVNANCGVSFNVNEFTSTVGEILRMSKESVPQFANDLISLALQRAKTQSQLHSKVAETGIQRSSVIKSDI
ncbi:hypothetical protein MP228_002927 [Amoeboaphelidium protococcarum]|nr:hypothetical protein MP228_002927 [Amoeboaphelidium protococcarum]